MTDIEPELRTEGQNEDDIDEPDEPDEPRRGPYPLNASEDRRAYHRWLRTGAADARRRRRPDAREPGAHLAAARAAPARERARAGLAHTAVGARALRRLGPRPDLRRLGALPVRRRLGRRRAHRRTCERCAGVDRRIKVTALTENGGISAATNAALAIARGRSSPSSTTTTSSRRCPRGRSRRRSPRTPRRTSSTPTRTRSTPAGERFDPLFKPEWSPDLLLSFAYICHLTVVRRSLVIELGGLRGEFDGSQDYDLSLRATEQARRIVHLPEVLYHWRHAPGLGGVATRRARSPSPGPTRRAARAIEDALPAVARRAR